MKLSTRGRYGTRLMLELTKNYGKGPISMNEIAKNQNIPIKYLEQLILPLKKANLIKSVRGPKGGHMLSKSPDKINLWDVVNLLESKFMFTECVSNEHVCENADNCLIRPVWEKAYDGLKKLFEETTLADVLRDDMLKG
ncbi:MAG: Rrf2 family transcriptional regulator [Deltaproteobacteria bacterium]|nr:Rrf2 family transcriptional regulator [Deltaproteobacteria bacterium]